MRKDEQWNTLKQTASQELSIKDHTDVNPLMLPVAEDVLSFSSGVWSNQSISQLTPITQIKDRLDTLESHQYPESL